VPAAMRATGPRWRASRRTNVALAGLLAVAFGTGWLGYGVGAAPWSQLVAVVHALAGLGLLVLAPWKALIVTRAWRRRSGTLAGAALALLVVTSVVAGVVHSAAGWAATGGLALQIHVGAAVIAVLFVLIHIGRHPQRPRRVDVSRRNAVRLLGVASGAALGYAATHGIASVLALPGGRGRATGSTEVGTGDPRAMPVTQWFVDTVPRVDPHEWRLDVRWPGGSRSLSYGDLVSLA